MEIKLLIIKMNIVQKLKTNQWRSQKTEVRESKQRISRTKGHLSKRTAFVREIVKEVAGYVFLHVHLHTLVLSPFGSPAVGFHLVLVDCCSTPTYLAKSEKREERKPLNQCILLIIRKAIMFSGNSEEYLPMAATWFPLQNPLF